MAGKKKQTAAGNGGDDRIEVAIGREVHGFRKRLNMTLRDLAHGTGLSPAMLSKIENGQAVPSLGTLQALARAFGIPMNVFFRGFEERRDASLVRRGQGVRISRRGRHIDHEFRLIGHSANRRVAFEPYLVRLTGGAEAFPRIQDSGVWFIHVLEGKLVFRYGDNLYRLGPGDSLTYDAESPHGTERLLEVPVTYLCIHADSRVV